MKLLSYVDRKIKVNKRDRIRPSVCARALMFVAREARAGGGSGALPLVSAFLDQQEQL